MAIRYRLMERIKPTDPTAPRKHYAVSQSIGDVNLRKLSEQIAEISTVSSIDTLAVLESFLQVANDGVITIKHFY